MPIVPLFGHEALRERLVKAAQRDALPPSLLLHGPARVGKQRLALWLAQALLCEAPGADTGAPCGRCRSCRFSVELAHPDLHWFFPRPRSSDIDTASDALEDLEAALRERLAAHGLYAAPSGADGIRIAYVQALLQRAALSPAMSSRKVFVVGDAHQMVQGGTEAAANAFLKLLEEPPANATIILTSSEPGALLPTIRSRVAMIRVPRIANEAVRAFLALPPVREAMASQGLADDDDALVRMADGAPGDLIGASGRAEAAAAAKRLLESLDAGRASRLRAAFVQGGAGARGPFADTLDELTAALRDRARDASERQDERAAFRYSVAVAHVEEARERANDNVNPQLITAALLRALDREAPR